jgi:hypothetical protein
MTAKGSTRKIAKVLLSGILITLLAGAGPEPRLIAQGGPPVVGISGDKFTVNGVPQFLVFFSYFGALRPDGQSTTRFSTAAFDSYANNTLFGHFQLLKAKGFDGVRIFPNWWLNVDTGVGCTRDPFPLIRPNGTVDTETAYRLGRVLSLAAQAGLLVDVSFAAETVTDVTPAFLQSYMNGLLWVTGAMKNLHPNAFFDVQNEYSIGGHICKPAAQTTTDIGNAIAYLKNPLNCYPGTSYCGDPNRIMFASGFGTTSIVTNGQTANMNVAAFHGSRGFGYSYQIGAEDFPEWVDAAFFESTAIKNNMSTYGWIRPLYFQEPIFYWPGYPCYNSFQCNNIRMHFYQAAQNAKQQGAAAWTFHTEGTFKEYGAALTLHPVEQQFIGLIGPNYDLVQTIKNYPYWGVF